MDMHRDTPQTLTAKLPLQDKLARTHRVVHKQLPYVARIAVALYDPRTTVLKTYMHSSGGRDPRSHNDAVLSDEPTLAKILNEGRPQVIHDMWTFDSDRHEHARHIAGDSSAASYAMPFFSNGVFLGFIFFNSFTPDVFTDTALNRLDVVGHLIALMLICELASTRTLLLAATSAPRVVHKHDLETGSHIDRMSRYARLIARELAPRHELDDHYIECVSMYSPLHDIGKVGIPDRILFKPDKLDRTETEVMRTHPRRGREIIDDVLRNFGFDGLQHVSILRNIAEYHHETLNGKGYPAGLQGNAVPLEARIVAVADIFDAFTSRRPYKEAWTNGEALTELKRMAGEELDGECVDALVRCREEVERIQKQVRENRIG